jgi:hypothetical protein
MIGRLDCKITRNGNQTPFFRGTRVDSHFSNAPFFLCSASRSRVKRGSIFNLP